MNIGIVKNDALALFGGRRAVSEQIASFAPLSRREERALLRSVRNTPLTTLYGGYDVARLEHLFAETFGFRHCVAMSSGTASLHSALVACGVRSGDEVIVAPHSFVASVSVVVQQGAKPVFCDIERDTLGIDVDQCATLIGPKTRAVIPVHLYGMPMRIDRLAKLCRQRGVALIEDCACAPGSRWQKRSVGSFGEAGCFSFNVGKVLRTGEGGMVATGDRALAERLREIRVNGLNSTKGVNNVNSLGFNYTLAQPLAAIGTIQVSMFNQISKRRRANAELLTAGLRDLPLQFLPTPSAVTSVPYMTPMLLHPSYVALRDRIIKAAQAEGVPLGRGYGEPLYRVSYLSRFARGKRFPVTESVTSRILTLDPAAHLRPRQLRQYIYGIRKVFANIEVLSAAAL